MIVGREVEFKWWRGEIGEVALIFVSLNSERYFQTFSLSICLFLLHFVSYKEGITWVEWNCGGANNMGGFHEWICLACDRIYAKVGLEFQKIKINLPGLPFINPIYLKSRSPLELVIGQISSLSGLSPAASFQM